MRSLFYFILTVVIFKTGLIYGLRLTDVTIPRNMDLHQAAVLICKFDVGGGKLYSVKWYKDEFEFFRYMPDNAPQIQTFPQHGINLDLSQSNMTMVTLQPLNFNSSGAYRCEVSTDGPNFETVVRNGNMTVMVYPEDDPAIDGINQRYSTGEFITGNCTSAKSNPPADLAWYINNDKAETWYLEKYPLIESEGPLYARALGIRFQLEDRHFQNKDRLELRCRAKIADLPHWERKVVVWPAYSRFSNHKPAPDRYRNNGKQYHVMGFLVMTGSFLQFII